MFPLWATFKGSTQQTWAGHTYEIHGAFYLAIASIAMGVALFVTSGVAWPPPGLAWVFLVGAACFLARGIHLLRVRSRLDKART